jgi:DNA-binding transcriptional LysR family regulator
MPKESLVGSVTHASLNNNRMFLAITVHNSCMIDPRLNVLRVVAARGTVTAAAETLNFSPSAVSHQLRSLASDLGVPLLEKDGRGVRLTAPARILLRHADDLYARWEEIRSDLAATDPHQITSFRLCGFSTAASALLPDVAARVRATYPHCTVRIIEADPEECFDLLLAQQADLAVVVATASIPPSTDARFDQEPLLDDPLDLLVPADHVLASRKSVLLREAAHEPWIMDRPGRPHHSLVLTACAAAGFTPSIAHQSTEWDTGAALVGAGLGVALIPRLARIPTGDRIVRVPLRGDPTPARRIVTAVQSGSRGQPAIATALTALAEVASRRTGGPLAPHRLERG